VESHDWHYTHVVLLGDQGVDRARFLGVAFLYVFSPVLAGRLAFVGLVSENGHEAIGDVFGLLLVQDAFVRTWFVVAVVWGSNGGGDREGEDGGEEDELHVGLMVRWMCVVCGE
jgi:hypothetical protein